MQSFVFEVKDDGDLEKVVARLWNRLAITGEMGIQQIGHGRWKLEVCSEKAIASAALNDLGCEQVG
jgi:hypothetical protein